MATWFDIPLDYNDPDRFIPSELANAWSYNVVAAFEGASGAPRLFLGAIERLSPGTQIRSRVDDEQSAVSPAVVVGHSFAFMQAGTIRVTFEHRATSTAGSPVALIERTRNGTITTVATFPQSTSYTVASADVPVLPGDIVSMVSNPSSAGGSAFIRNCRFQTNGQNLWPGVGVRLEGNVFL